MLGALRRQSQSIFIKILLSLLILSFAVWGVGDMVSSAVTETAAVRVGDIEVGPQRLQREYRGELNRLQRMGMKLDSEQARQLGVMQSVATQVAERLLLTEASRRLGLSVSDQVIQDWIARAPEFQDATGRFDRSRFFQMLVYNNLSEQGFMDVVREDLARNGLTNVLSEGTVAPDAMLDLIIKYQLEKRRIGLATLPVNSDSAVKDPTDSELEVFHKENTANYMRPELRTLSTVIIRVDDIAKTIKVPEERIAQAYDARKDEFVTKATVDLEQMLFATKDEAVKAKERVSAGESFSIVAKDMLDLESSDIALGKLTSDEIQPSELADAAFSLPVNGVSDPVKSPLGWHLITITAKTERREQSLEDVREALASQVAREMGMDILYERVSELENILAESGGTLENGAQALGLDVRTLPAMDIRGNDADGNAISDLPERATFIETAFQTAQGAVSPVIDGEASAFVVRVDAINPAAVTPLADIRDRVVADWKDQQRRNATRTTAEEILKKASEGGNLEGLVAEVGGTYQMTPAIFRDGSADGEQGPDLPSDLLTKVFAEKAGALALGETESGYLLARVEEILPADKPDAERLAREADNLANLMNRDLINHLIDQLRVQIGVQINQGVMDELY